ncbi:MFS transporter [Rothia sp. AR01]|uniref:MFS transporter n=2 Tax=Rothia santali TaxID=2949643 RepID=A0A9X2KJD7_9MICC|nr:MDR family MFS transporter [Rothia santali]MCP3426744.1 MFS transporter [Rothia santali]
MSTSYTPRHSRRGDSAVMERPQASSAPAQTSTHHHGGEASHTNILLLFIGLMIIMLMSSLNQTVLSPSLPTIVGELNGVEHMSWVITAFILVSTIMMPVYGKLGDLWGRKPLLVFAIIAFAGGSLTGAVAQDMTTLIISRGLQGLGGGGLMILSQAVIADVIPARDRGKYMGALMGVFAFSSVAGPLLGGWLTEGPGWRWGFWMNLPLAALALFAAIFLIPHTNKSVRTERSKIDVLGMALLAAATACLVLAMTWGGNQYDWGSPTIVGLLIATVVAVAVFIPVEAKVAEPVMPLTLFKDRNFNLTTIASLCMGIAMFGAIGYMPTYMQMVLGVSATQAGLLMIPMMGTMLVTSVTVGAVVSKLGRYKAFTVIGSLFIAAGLFFLSRLEVQTPTWEICVCLALIGLGLGMSMQLLTLIVQNSFPISMVGTATASSNFFRQVGATIGSALVGGLFTARLTTFLGERLPVQAMSDGGGANSLTPALVNALPGPIHDIIVNSYNEALTPIFLWIMPLGVLAALLLMFIVEKALATTVGESGTTSQAAGDESSESIRDEEPARVGGRDERDRADGEDPEERSPRTGEIPIPETGSMMPTR